jgi:FlaG/FlaF family flagellin (archaellin)
MLVITVIIAAVVSTFAGNFVQGQEKVPQALVQGTFSISSGFTIQHMGGDAIPVNDAVITVRNSREFGPDVEYRSVSLVNQSVIKDSRNMAWIHPRTGSIQVRTFTSGDTAYIDPDDCGCGELQPIIAPHVPNGYLPIKLQADGSFAERRQIATGAISAALTSGNGATPISLTNPFFVLCFKNKNNIGKSFIMDVSDRATGKIISTTNVQIVA